MGVRVFLVLICCVVRLICLLYYQYIYIFFCIFLNYYFFKFFLYHLVLFDHCACAVYVYNIQIVRNLIKIISPHLFPIFYSDYKTSIENREQVRRSNFNQIGSSGPLLCKSVLTQIFFVRYTTEQQNTVQKQITIAITYLFNNENSVIRSNEETIGTVRKENRKMDRNTQIHDRSLSWLDIGISIIM